MPLPSSNAAAGARATIDAARARDAEERGLEAWKEAERRTGDDDACCWWWWCWKGCVGEREVLRRCAVMGRKPLFCLAAKARDPPPSHVLLLRGDGPTCQGQVCGEDGALHLRLRGAEQETLVSG